MSDAKTLLDLSKADFALLRLKKQLDSLPQREKLLELRTKRAEVELKAAQVEALRKECEQKTKAFADEEASLREKTAAAQVQIDETTNYKEVASLSREIEGFAKRVEKIEYDTLRQMEHADKIATVAAQVAAALEKLARQDAELLASYQAAGAVLQKEQLETQQTRARLVDSLAPAVRARYEKAREAKGGVGAAFLEGSHCSGCRVELTAGQIGKLKSETEADMKTGSGIGECPYCHRLLVVEV